MTFWVILLVLTFACYGLCSQLHGKSRKRLVVYIYSFVLIFIAGMRSGIGDTGYYLSWFNNYKTSSIPSIIGAEVKDAGFAVFMAIVGKITQIPQMFLLIVAFICIGFTLYTVAHYSRDIAMSLYLFLTAGFFLGMMNGIRQYLVVAVLFLAINCLLRNKWLPYISMTLLLSTVHTSALFMIPSFFLVQRPVWKKNTVILLVGTSFIIINISTFLPWLGGILEGSVYSGYTESLENSVGSGANIFRVLVMIVPVVISYIGRKHFASDDQEYKIYSNMMILNAICYLFAASNWIFARLGMYLHIYILLFYPLVLPRVFKGNNLKIVKALLILMYTVYFLFEVRNTPYMSYYLKINTDLIGPFTWSLY